MRITQGMLYRNYLNNINFNQECIAKSNQRIQSSRRYTRVSENVSEASQALRVRRQLGELRRQKTSASNAQGIVAAAESNMRSINDILISAREKALRGINGPMESVRNEVGEELENLKDQVLQFMNSKYAGKFLMGGVNNKFAPYQVQDYELPDGTIQENTLTYNGIPVNDIKVDESGKYYYLTDPTDDTTKQIIPYDKEIYIDLGTGFAVGEDGTVDPRSAFNLSFNGLDILGFGESVDERTGEKLPDNIYNLMQKMVDMFTGKEPYNELLMDSMVDKLEGVRETMFLNVTDLGNRDNFLTNTIGRIDSESTILTETRSKLEGVDDTAESIRLSMYQYSWLATLKMGAKLLPQSLMDYIT